MPTWATWAIVLVNVAAVVATVAALLRGKGSVAGKVAAQPSSSDNANRLAEVGKAMDLYSDLVAAGKTAEEARNALAPVVQTLAFPGPAAPNGAAK